MSDIDELKQILDIIIPRDGEIEGMTAELHDKAVETAKTKINRLIVEAKNKFIRDKQIIEKFETLAEYIPKLGQYGYIEGMREEVDDFIAELYNNLSKGDGDEANGA